VATERGRQESPTDARKISFSPLHVLRDAVLLGITLVGLVSGVAGLLVAGEAGRMALRGIAALCIIYALVHVFNYLLVQDKRALQLKLDQKTEELAKRTREYQRYKERAVLDRQRCLGAITRLVDRQTLQYEEELEVTVVIGADDTGDMIVERHVTTPTPYLIYRSLRPVLPQNTATIPTFHDLGMTACAINEEGITFTILPLVETGPGMRVLIIFEPPVDSMLIWTLSYHPKGLWTPLRQDEIDFFNWDARTPLGRLNESTYTRLQIKFEFPQGTSSLMVRERRGRGTTTHEPGTPCVVWQAESPLGTEFEWDLSMPQVSR
jgi:hypothetical protein